MVWTHLYADGTATIPLHAGGSVTLRQTTRYPWDGQVRVEVADIHEAGDFTLYLRIPEWAQGATGDVNGEALFPSETAAGQYAAIRRTWRASDAVTLNFPMPVRRMVSHPYALENTGRVALMRGPLLYCLEAADNPVGDVRDVVLADDEEIVAARRPDLLNDVVVLMAHAENQSAVSGWEGALYRSLDDVSRDRPGSSDVLVTAIPYYAWANRGAGAMTVWLKRTPGGASDLPAHRPTRSTAREM
jgi:DUF1680 family protein